MFTDSDTSADFVTELWTKSKLKFVGSARRRGARWYWCCRVGCRRWRRRRNELRRGNCTLYTHKFYCVPCENSEQIIEKDLFTAYDYQFIYLPISAKIFVSGVRGPSCQMPLS